MPSRVLSFSRLLDLPENHSALVAVHELAAAISTGRFDGQPNPLYLHGPTGVGKSCLANGLKAEVLRAAGHVVISALTAKEVDSLVGACETADSSTRMVDEVDLLIVEDLHQLAPRFADPLAHLVDDLRRRNIPMVFTALA